jgi:hypothetical protein
MATVWNWEGMCPYKGDVVSSMVFTGGFKHFGISKFNVAINSEIWSPYFSVNCSVLLSSLNVRIFVLPVHFLLLHVSCTNNKNKLEIIAECILLLKSISTARAVGSSFSWATSWFSWNVRTLRVRACLRVCVCEKSLQKHLIWNNIMILLILLLPTCLASGSYIDSHAWGFTLFSSSSLISCLILHCLNFY